MKLKIKQMREGAVIPKRATAESAGLDLSAYLDRDVVINPGEIVKIPTGIAIGLEKGTVGMVYPRSGLASKHGITLATRRRHRQRLPRRNSGARLPITPGFPLPFKTAIGSLSWSFPPCCFRKSKRRRSWTKPKGGLADSAPPAVKSCHEKRK